MQDFASTPNQQFVLTLGDIIDGYALPNDPQRGKTISDLHMIAGMFDSLLPDRAVHHVLGNHCLAANRAELLQVHCAVQCSATELLHASSHGAATHTHAKWAALCLCAVKPRTQAAHPHVSCV